MSYILFGGTRGDNPNALSLILGTASTLDDVLLPLKPDFTAEEFIENAATHRVRRVHDDTTLWFHVSSRRAVEWWQVLNTATSKLATYGGRCWNVADFPRAVLQTGDANQILFERAPLPSVRPTEKDLRLFTSVLPLGDLDSNPQQMYVNRKMRAVQQNVVADMAKAVRSCSAARV